MTGQRVVLVAVVCFAFAGCPSKSADLAVENDADTRAPSRDPRTHWQASQRNLPAGRLVRRMVFARDGLSVTHSAPNEQTATSLYLSWTSPDLITRSVGDDGDLGCPAQGVSYDAVDSALARLVATDTWKQSEKQMQALLLECFNTSEVFWELITDDTAAAPAGVPIESIQVPFDGRPLPRRTALPADH